MKAINKDFVKELSNTKTRFLSIFLIVALGVSIFAGLRCSKPGMNRTGDEYYDETMFYDIRVISTMGLTDDDINAIKTVDGVINAEGGKNTALIFEADNVQSVIKLKSITENINRYYLTDGKEPSSVNECLIDEYFLEEYGYSIGDTITFDASDNEDMDNSIYINEFVITGTAKHPEYLMQSRGNTTLSDGKVDFYMIVPENVFVQDYYSEVYAVTEGSLALDSYSDEYEKLNDNIVERIEVIAGARCDIRLAEVLKEPYEELADAEAEYNEALNEYNSKKEETYKKLEAADKETEAALLEYNSGLEELEFNKSSLLALGYTEEMVSAALGEAEASLAAAKEQIEQALTDKAAGYAEAEKEFGKAWEELEAANQKITDTYKELKSTAAPEWYVLTRYANESFVSLSQDADRIDAIAKVFPGIFFLVAILVTLTTMTRMVDEQRIQIGTLKALGYSKNKIAAKYINYALLASITGSVCGAFIGEKLFPYVIIISYKLMYVTAKC